MIDCLIIGGGPAGLLAAIYLGRYLRSVCLIDARESRAAKIPESHNYPGFLGIGGPELLRRLRAQAQEYGVPSTTDRVTSLRKEGESFVVSCKSGNDVDARFVLLATGLLDHCPAIEGEQDNCPSEVICFCPICDGYEAIDRRVGVLGDIEAGSKKALFLRTYTKHVSLFLTDETMDADSRQKLDEEDVRIVHKPKQIKLANECTVAILTESGERHDLDALYPALGCTVRSELATALGASCTENGNLVVEHQRTTVEGLYAAGDVVTDLHQLSVAFGHAAIAATDIHNRLPSNPRQTERRRPKSVAEPRSV
jgi:thioredoxin reductase (NADPH)